MAGKLRSVVSTGLILLFVLLDKRFFEELVGTLLTNLLIAFLLTALILQLWKLFGKRLRLLFSFTNFFSKLPKAGLVIFAFLGVLFIGISIGGLSSAPRQDTQPENGTQAAKLINLVKGYEEMDRMYYLQGQDVGVIMDVNIIENYPNEFYDAVKSINKRRDLINVQYGRILELRRAAGLTESPATKTD